MTLLLLAHRGGYCALVNLFSRTHVGDHFHYLVINPKAENVEDNIKCSAHKMVASMSLITDLSGYSER